jgi:hypothetical protein
MSLLDQIRTDSLNARREGSDLSPFLTQTLAEIEARAKADGQRAPTDADAEAVVRAAIKSWTKALAGDPAKGVPPIPADSDYGFEIAGKLDYLNPLVPGMLEGAELEAAIAGLGIERSPKSMGLIMKALNAAYPGRVDGALVKANLI